MRSHLFALIVAAALPATALADPAAKADPAKRPTVAHKAALKVTSVAFKANEAIPSEYTCEGAQTPPPLVWSKVPKATRSIALLVEDPDAPGGTFTHWLVTGIPATATGLPAGRTLPDGAVAAKNGKGDTGYAGPCPPTGRHHYNFHIYALDNTVPPPSAKDDFLSSIEGHVIAEGKLTGTYQKAGAQSGKPAALPSDKPVDKPESSTKPQ